jgi:hypothetical protein
VETISTGGICCAKRWRLPIFPSSFSPPKLIEPITAWTWFWPPTIIFSIAFVGGYLDLGASLDHVYEYLVTSYNVDGVESDLSQALIVTANSQRVFLPLIRR